MKDYYRKQGIEKMPIKWIAPEAMYDGISNEKTDVVSVYSYMHIKMMYNSFSMGNVIW